METSFIGKNLVHLSLGYSLMQLFPKSYTKICVKRPLSKRQNIGFKTSYRIMQVKSIAECFLQYFRPSLSYHVSLTSLFCLYLSGYFTHVLLYSLKMSERPTSPSSKNKKKWAHKSHAFVNDAILCRDYASYFI